MLIATTNELPGYVIEEVFGEVFGLTVRSRNIGSQIGAGLKSMFGGELKGMTKALVDSRNEVIQRMIGRGRAEGRERDRRHALRHVRDGRHVDGDLRVRHGGASPQGVDSEAEDPFGRVRTGAASRPPATVDCRCQAPWFRLPTVDRWAGRGASADGVSAFELSVPGTGVRVRQPARAQSGAMPRVRRSRRPAPVLELLAATLPELRRGLTESAARTVAYEVFEKLGCGAVAVTDTQRVLAYVGAGADHHAAGDQPIRPVYEALAQDRPLLAPLGIRVECGHPACPLGAAAVVPLRLSGRARRRGRRLLDRRLAARRAHGRDSRGARRPALRAAAAVRARLGDDHRAAGPDGAALRLQRAEHDRRVHPDGSRPRADGSCWRSPTTCAAGSRGPASSSPWTTSSATSAATSSLEEARFGPQLEVTVDADPAARRVRLPPLLVQPLVENAIKHGKTDRTLHLLIRARVRRGRLRVTVRDDGRGIARDVLDRVLEPGVSDNGGMGLGLANVHGRLTAHYGEGMKLRSFPFGTVVRLEVPVSEDDA